GNRVPDTTHEGFEKRLSVASLLGERRLGEQLDVFVAPGLFQELPQGSGRVSMVEEVFQGHSLFSELLESLPQPLMQFGSHLLGDLLTGLPLANRIVNGVPAPGIWISEVERFVFRHRSDPLKRPHGSRSVSIVIIGLHFTKSTGNQIVVAKCKTFG